LEFGVDRGLPAPGKARLFEGSWLEALEFVDVILSWSMLQRFAKGLFDMGEKQGTQPTFGSTVEIT
jgi:hypothetical protein